MARENFYIVDKNEEFKIEKISKEPTVLEGIHESCFRSFHTMNLMTEMLERGDSAETILMVVRHLGLRQNETEFTKAENSNK